ncbi:MAG: hypothetical protein HOE90_10555 [Bacteriovoracaceae bacterium]|jgi:hypothetical protein|nr:hypothetical protein [Bacteriovoracaceae bacterium]
MRKQRKLYPLTDLQTLKRWDSLDVASYNLLKSYVERKKNILIIGNKRSGKTTLLHSIAEYAYRLQYNPVVMPLEENVCLDSYFTRTKWKNRRRWFKQTGHLFAHVGYKGSYEDLYPFVKSIGTDFDVVLDMRNIGSKRVLCQIFERRKGKWVNPYFNNKFFNHDKATFAA